MGCGDTCPSIPAWDGCTVRRRRVASQQRPCHGRADGPGEQSKLVWRLRGSECRFQRSLNTGATTTCGAPVDNLSTSPNAEIPN
jgi:hypothetical protein